MKKSIHTQTLNKLINSISRQHRIVHHCFFFSRHCNCYTIWKFAPNKEIYGQKNAMKPSWFTGGFNRSNVYQMTNSMHRSTLIFRSFANRHFSLSFCFLLLGKSMGHTPSYLDHPNRSVENVGGCPDSIELIIQKVKLQSYNLEYRHYQIKPSTNQSNKQPITTYHNCNFQ